MIMDSIKAYKHIIWDWNGTLLDDIDIVIKCMNHLLKRRNLPLLDASKYKDIFTFPVKDYYSQLGFDFATEPFEKLASEFIGEFSSEMHQFKLHAGTKQMLDCIKQMGIGQSILSASQECELIEVVSKLGIEDYFFRIAGLNNHYAVSKVERGKELLDELALEPHEVLLIGDTIHDYEVATELGCECLLVCNGHQSYERLKGCNARTIDAISGLIDFIEAEAIA